MKDPMHKTLPFLLAFVFLTFSACDSTDPGDGDGPGEEELITRVVLTLTGGGETRTATASDPDGDGTNFEIDPIVLAAGTTYTGTIALFDDVNDENITEEIEEEDDEHQFFYTVAGAAADRVTVTITDRDENGLPVGLAFTVDVSAGGAGAGTLNVVLSHFDDEPKTGTTRSDETDVDVTFPLTIE
ncbi:MAG: hypothetical protein R3247_06305 [Rhodothermales bacterium]|nr:hypothetical protein [Rhodothermales bacterium]